MHSRRKIHVHQKLGLAWAKLPLNNCIYMTNIQIAATLIVQFKYNYLCMLSEPLLNQIIIKYMHIITWINHITLVVGLINNCVHY